MKRHFWKNISAVQGGPKIIENNFWDFDKNLIYLYVLFLLEYEGTNGFLSFYRNHMYWKNLILELQSKNL